MSGTYYGMDEGGNLVSGAWLEDSNLPEGQTMHLVTEEGVGIGWLWTGSAYEERVVGISIEDCVNMKKRLLEDSYTVIVDYFEQTQAEAVGVTVDSPMSEASFKEWVVYRSKLKSWDPVPGNPVPTR